MRLYSYDHCPFSTRVRYVAGLLNLELNPQTLAFDDEQTTVDIIGKKQVPVLVSCEHEAIAESNDIITYLLDLSGLNETGEPSEDVKEWQSNAFLTLQQIGYPRWTSLPLGEFATESAKEAWRAKKETGEFNFKELISESSIIAGKAKILIGQAHEILNKWPSRSRSYVDRAIIFSILRGFSSLEAIEWMPEMRKWLEEQSKESGVYLLNSNLSFTLN
ncbi:glutaredoxin 2 [Vibrio splendidus]|uniref:Glutaredoxin 2 (Grx2) n=2 Tax=Vibrio TaxID=662 RepID=A0A4R3PGE8_9VIBR|nr:MULTISPECIES: glutaredoxin 2 [Vibrio]MDH5919815.1 glutaredoxin 2 [Vibrio splendidus]TCN05622.1 glutaredoxin 2 [Vibrio crassostreae]TCT46130.1 glutaredoxin 2 [Vibrio crassostreae]TCT54263.1 glutaredoxin 2 [Vibrio crassostreae]TCT58870.1 glutaredoxin 2 [Vibrio crassostreae]